MIRYSTAITFFLILVLIGILYNTANVGRSAPPEPVPARL